MPIRESKYLIQSGQWILYCGIFGGNKKRREEKTDVSAPGPSSARPRVLLAPVKRPTRQRGDGS